MRVPIRVALVCLVLSPAVADPPVARSTRTAEPISIDGLLDEPAWAGAAWNGDFQDARPGRQGPAAVQTRFAVLHDDDALLVGIVCDEPQPDRIVAQARAHDGLVWSDDCVEVFLDPGGDGRYYQHFAISSRGVWYDDTGADYGLVQTKLWDFPLTAAGQVDAESARWTLEARLPFAAMVLPRDVAPRWRLNVTRARRASGEEELSSWSPLTSNFHQPRLFGGLTGVDVDFTPFRWRIGEPQVAVSADGSGRKSLRVASSIGNDSRSEADVRPAAGLFLSDGAPAALDPVHIAPGAESTVTFAPLLAPADVRDPCVLIELRDAGTGRLLRSVVRRVSADYRPVRVTVLRPCYRNSIYATEKIGAIEFRVDLSADVATATTEVRWRLEREDGSVVSSSTVALADLAQPLSAPAADLEVGTYPLVVEAAGPGGVLATERVPIHKLPPPPAGDEVRIDGNGVVRVNGEPFVGIGWYGEVPLNDPRPDAVALQNLQIPVVVDLASPEAVRQAFEEHGIRSVVSVELGRLLYTFELWRDPTQTVTTEDTKLSAPSDKTRELMQRLIDAVRGQPGLVGYYIADEPEIHDTRSGYLEAFYRLLGELDPYHPVVVTNDTLDGITTHGYRCADILSPDPYSPALDYVPNFVKRCRSVMGPGQALWLTPWHSATDTHMTVPWGEGRPYPYRVMRNQALVSLAYGAQAWTGYTSPFFLEEPELRFGLPHIWREIRFLERALAAPAPTEPLTVEAEGELAGWIRQADGAIYAVLVNHSAVPVSARVSHPLLRGIDRLREIADGRDVPVADSALTDTLASGDARIYTTDPRAAGLPTVAAVEAEIAQARADSAKPGNLLHVSRGVRATASEGYYAPWFSQYYTYAINGYSDDRGWALTHAGGKPAWLELSLPEAAPVGRIVLYAPNLKDYDLQFAGPDGSIHRAEVRGATGTVLEHSLQPPLKCTRIRITAVAGHEGAGAPQVSEVEAYSEPGAAPPLVLTVTQAAAERPATFLPPPGQVEPNDLWVEDFTAFAPRPAFRWDGTDTEWVLDATKFAAEPLPGGGLAAHSTAAEGYAIAQHFFDYDPAHRFLQVAVRSIDGEGYRWFSLGFGSSSGEPGYRGAVSASRPGIYTVDVHSLHESYRTGAATQGFAALCVAGSSKAEAGGVAPGPRFVFDWVRLAARPTDGLAVTLADGSPLPDVIRQGQALLFHVVLAEPAQEVTVDAQADAGYVPLPLNGEPYVPLLRIGAEDGREWAAAVTLGPGTGTYDAQKSGYPIVFRAQIRGGAIAETYVCAMVSVQ